MMLSTSMRIIYLVVLTTGVSKAGGDALRAFTIEVPGDESGTGSERLPMASKRFSVAASNSRQSSCVESSWPTDAPEMGQLLTGPSPGDGSGDMYFDSESSYCPSS